MPMGPSDRGPRHPANFGAQARSTQIQKITINATTTAGTAVSGVTVTLFDVSTNLPLQQGTTDANGNVVFYLNNSFTCFARCFKAGSPNIVSTTDSTLVAA